MINFVDMEQNGIFNIIVAAGSGSRFGADRPKQFCLLGNRPVLMHTIDNMRQALPKSQILLVISNEHKELWNDLCQEYEFISPTIIEGGGTRWESVKNAINHIPADKAEIITVHDGARPIIDKHLINNVITGIGNNSGAIPVIPVTDSLRMISTDNAPSVPVDRSLFRAVQTPQAFRADRLINAYSMPYKESFTDDASVMKAAGFDDIELVEGNPYNIKITLPLDIEIASIYMSEK